MNKGRKRTRQEFLIRCHIVDDHCGALRHIHAAIRRRDLPFSSLRMMHWDAHPDLMVTPDLTAATCFQPHDLYEALQEAEGGIAEWILPLVFQGHLSNLWWIRPYWANQFRDGVYRFSIGRVRSSGVLRVSSTAPYFVDDQLYCPESLMEDCKVLNLHVSRDVDWDVDGDHTDVPPYAEGEFGQIRSNSTRRKSSSKMTMGSSKGGLPSSDETGKHCTLTNAAVAESRAQDSKAPDGINVPSATKDAESRPWALDICLDYFTTENPFMKELESRIDETAASLVQDFYERPRFRGARTKLSHSEQVEHERIFKEEVMELLGTCDGCEEGGNAAKAHRTTTKPVSAAASEPGSLVGTERLRGLFEDIPDDRLLVDRFVSMVRCLTPEQRKLVAWVDNCACLPRHVATRDEVRVAVLRMEHLLRCVMRRRGGWAGPPGVVTIARSQGDGYVPADMVGFIEGEVLAMLKRLFDNKAGKGLEIVYDDGLETRGE